MKNIVIFASGSGTNAERIIKYFADNQQIVVSCVYTNNSTAGVIERAQNLNVPVEVFNRSDLYDNNRITDHLNTIKPDLIVLAGFLWLVPKSVINDYDIINIHPALLPNYGGKGMYGMKVHEAVIAAKEPKSGITIHWVNDKYDEGQIIFQADFEIEEGETPESLAQRIHQLEYAYFPEVIEELLRV